MQVKNRKMVQNLVLSALMAGLIMVTTFIIRVPVPATQGYIHFGDAVIIFTVILLGWKRGAIVAAIGSSFADLIVGAAIYIPVTFIIKGLMAIVIGIFFEKATRAGIGIGKSRSLVVLGIALGGIILIAGYYLFEVIIYGNFVAPIIGAPMNALQFIVGVILGLVAYKAMYKTSLRKEFVINLGPVLESDKKTEK